MLEARRMMAVTLPPPDGTPPPEGGWVGRGNSPMIVTIDDPNGIDDPNERMLTPNGNVLARPAASLTGILSAMDDPNE